MRSSDLSNPQTRRTVILLISVTFHCRTLDTTAVIALADWENAKPSLLGKPRRNGNIESQPTIDENKEITDDTELVTAESNYAVDVDSSSLLKDLQ